MLSFIILLMLFELVWSDNVTIPKFNESEWWGSEERTRCEDTSIRSFKVEFKDSMVDDLKSRLKNTIYSEPLNGVGSTYGLNSKQLPGWIKYWREEYPFKEREEFFNQFPQYKICIQGLDIHFLWVKPHVTNGIKILPLLLLHGWPGSVREFYEAIPLLTRNDTGYNFTFEVIAPSLPGFGFSDAPSHPGLAPPKIAVIFKNLMRELGFEKFYVQGGDWGSIIASNIVTLYPDDILGYHTNFPCILSSEILTKLIAGQFFPDAIMKPEMIDRIYPLSNILQYLIETLGYYFLQATRPDSIGIALSDSPAGLLTYILQAFMNNKDVPSLYEADSGFGKVGISKVKLIDNIMVYWSTNKIMSSMRLYKENREMKTYSDLSSIPSKVPTWALQAKYEMIYTPPKILKFKYPNLLGSTDLDFGGHFFALQHPEVYSADVFKAVNAFIEWNNNNNYTTFN